MQYEEIASQCQVGEYAEQAWDIPGGGYKPQCQQFAVYRVWWDTPSAALLVCEHHFKEMLKEEGGDVNVGD